MWQPSANKVQWEAEGTSCWQEGGGNGRGFEEGTELVCVDRRQIKRQRFEVMQKKCCLQHPPQNGAKAKTRQKCEGLSLITRNESPRASNGDFATGLLKNSLLLQYDEKGR